MAVIPAGPELDALVAEHVMGLKPCSDPMGLCDAAKTNPPMCWGNGEAGSGLDNYSTDIKDAWKVVEKIKGMEPQIGWNDEIGYWVCTIEKGGPTPGFGYTSKTAPHAVCLAALSAVGYEFKMNE